MNELTYSLFIITGFLLGSILLGYLAMYLTQIVPRFVKLKLRSRSKTNIYVFLRMTYPVFIWIAITTIVVWIIYTFFREYIVLFLSGATIALVFTLIDLITERKEEHV